MQATPRSGNKSKPEKLSIFKPNENAFEKSDWSSDKLVKVVYATLVEDLNNKPHPIVHTHGGLVSKVSQLYPKIPHKDIMWAIHRMTSTREVLNGNRCQPIAEFDKTDRRLWPTKEMGEWEKCDNVYILHPK